MQLMKIILLSLFIVLSLYGGLCGQTLTDKEYEVINDLYGCVGNSKKFRVYKTLEPNAKLKDLLNANPDSILFFLTMENDEFPQMMRSMNFDQKKMDSLDLYSYELKKSKVFKGIKVVNSIEKGVSISRPLISENYAIMYFKTPCENYIESYVFAKKILGKWVYYGDFQISAAFVDQLIPKNWRWKMRLAKLNIFRNNYCDD